MSVLTSVSAGMQGALLLARGRPDGIKLVETDQAAAIHSFWAIPLCLPAVVCLRLLEWLADGIPANVPLALGRYLLLFLVGWLVFVWLSHSLTRAIDRQQYWARFVAVWSYCSVIENTMVAIGGLPGALGAPTMISEVVDLVTLGWALWLEWYAIRLSLRVGALTAFVVLLVDVLVGIVTDGLGSLAG